MQVNHGNSFKQVPLQILNFSNTSVTDITFYEFVTGILGIHRKNREKYFKNKENFDYKTFLQIDFSRNLLTESSLITLGQVLKIFHGMSYIDLSSNKQIKFSRAFQFFDYMQHNHSVVYMDLRDIPVDLEVYKLIENLLNKNYVIQEFLVTINKEIVSYMEESRQLEKTFLFDLKYSATPR